MHLLVPFVALLTLVLINSTATAQVIQSCVKQNGNLRIVSSPSDCRSNEAPLSWNLEGDTGDPGADGETGPEGPPGPSLRAIAGDGTDLGIPLASNSDANFAVFNDELGLVLTKAF